MARLTKEQREAALRVVTYADPPESHFAEWILRLDEPEEPAVEGVSAGQGTPTDFLARYLAERAKILTRFAELERERDEARAERDEALAVRANQEVQRIAARGGKGGAGFVALVYRIRKGLAQVVDRCLGEGDE